MTHPEHTPEFPGEDDWLALPCPDYSADFVERTWQAIRTEQLAAADDFPWATVLPTYQVPPPAADFVRRTLARARQVPDPAAFAIAHERRVGRSSTDPGVQPSQLWLSAAGVPEPSPDFVDRVLDALRDGGEAAAPPRRAAGGWLALAAALVLAAVGLFALRSPADPALDFRRVARDAFTPDPWATALARIDDDLGVVVLDPAHRVAELAGLQEGD